VGLWLHTHHQLKDIGIRIKNAALEAVLDVDGPRKIQALLSTASIPAVDQHKSYLRVVRINIHFATVPQSS
jgi:hypothetical protein